MARARKQVDARILLGDCIAVMQSLDAETVDAVVCDPPYGIEFMGRDWDKFIPHDEVEMHPRWKDAKRTDPSETHWGDPADPKHGKLPSYGGRRTSYQCQKCGKRDAFRNPHKCGDEADWRSVPSYAGASPDVLAFEQFSKAWATEAYRVLKPGGHLLAFGATRMYHRLAAGIEDAGFEIRDSLHWIYGSGFPKSLDVSKQIDKKAGAERPDRVTEPMKNTIYSPEVLVVNAGTPVTEEAQQWEGWGTALKPAHEPIVMARKPLAGTVTETVLAYGTGALNIDAARPEGEPGSHAVERPKGKTDGATNFPPSATVREEVAGGRWPANILLAHLPECEGYGASNTDVLCAPGCPVAELNEASGHSASPVGEVEYSQPSAPATPGDVNPDSAATRRVVTATGYGDAGGAARFFYIAKPRKRERIGGTIRNLHPTVKPIDLMRHLVRLVTPPGGIVLDPFLGSGTTGCAAMIEGFRFVGIENDSASHETSLARIADYAFAHGRTRPASS
jgi:site-specific DNA-methyltransferase (adenine-specific)